MVQFLLYGTVTTSMVQLFTLWNRDKPYGTGFRDVRRHFAVRHVPAGGPQQHAAPQLHVH